MAYTVDEKELYSFGVGAIPKFLFAKPRAEEVMGAFVKIFDAARQSIDDLFEQTYVLNATGAGAAYLDQHAWERVGSRAEGETNAALRERIRNVADALTPVAILAAVQAILDEDGPTSPLAAMVELPSGAGYCQSLYAPSYVDDFDWFNKVGVLASNGVLSRAAGGSGWNAAGAVSAKEIPWGNDGYAEWTVASGWSIARRWMCGLSKGDIDQDYTDIDFAIEMDNGTINVYEGGVFKSGPHANPFVIGDILRVQVDGTTVTYWHNADPIYTSAVTLTSGNFPLLIDTAFWDYGGSIAHAVISGQAYASSFIPTPISDFAFAARSANVIWQDVANVIVDECHLEKWGGSPSTWDAGARSVRTVTSGSCYALFTTDEVDKKKVCGLSSGDTDQTLADVDFAIVLDASGNVEIFENGVSKGVVGTYVAGNTFRVESSGSAVTYYKGDALLYTSLATPSYPLLVDCSLYDLAATLRGVTLEQGNGFGYRADTFPANEVILILPYGTTAATQASILEALRQKKAAGIKGTLEVRQIP